MNAKWTPGPWTVLDYSSGDEHPPLVIHSDPDTRVCFMAGPGKLADIAVIEANARLIAEAPAMAEALEEAEDAMNTLLNTCTVIVGKYPDDGNIYEHEKWAEEELTKARDNLRAILARLEGRE